MTEPEETEEFEIEWRQPAAIVRAVYDEQGRLNSIVAEYTDVPPAEEVARIVAQFLMRPADVLPHREPGDSLAAAQRDQQVARQFQEVLGRLPDAECAAIANILDPGGFPDHDNHHCRRDLRHEGRHVCACGTRF